MLDKKLKKEIVNIKNCTDFILRNENIVNDKNISNFIFNMEKYRFNILNYFRILKSNCMLSQDIESINDKYKIEFNNNILKIFIPEMVPRNRDTGNYAYKNILLNILLISREYRNLYGNKYVYIYIKFFFNKENNDLDNRTIKPIIDGLVLSKVINDDSFKNIFYFLKGELNDFPHVEVYISDDKNVIIKELLI